MSERHLIPYDSNNNKVRQEEIFGYDRLEADKLKLKAPSYPAEFLSIVGYVSENYGTLTTTGKYIRSYPVGDDHWLRVWVNPGMKGVDTLDKSYVAISNFKQYDHLSEKGVYVPTGSYEVSESIFFDQNDMTLKVEKEMVRRSNKKKTVSATKDATLEDMEEAISVLMRAINNNDKTNVNMLPEVELEPSNTNWELERFKKYAVFTCEPKQIIGAVSLHFLSEHRKELEDIYILDEFRGMGYGQATLIAADELEFNDSKPPLTTYDYKINQTQAKFAIEALMRKGLVSKYYNSGEKSNYYTYQFKRGSISTPDNNNS
jgi:hypothetical protein